MAISKADHSSPFFVSEDACARCRVEVTNEMCNLYAHSFGNRESSHL